MEIAAEHAEAERQRAGMGVEERLLLDRIALHAADVAIRHVQHAAAIEAHLADAGGAVGNGTRVAARMTAQPAAVDRLDQLRRGLDRPGLEHLSESGHEFIRTDSEFYGRSQEIRKQENSSLLLLIS